MATKLSEEKRKVNKKLMEKANKIMKDQLLIKEKTKKKKNEEMKENEYKQGTKRHSKVELNETS